MTMIVDIRAATLLIKEAQNSLDKLRGLDQKDRILLIKVADFVNRSKGNGSFFEKIIDYFSGAPREMSFDYDFKTGKLLEHVQSSRQRTYVIKGKEKKYILGNLSCKRDKIFYSN